ncbi:unnamed protein product [Meganyctiphanes norvegica]|uniref:MRH domain-containing protein n=1 Tax=Meganyctiphanes norvegica TaxID=48144 RepID=A0AAV2PMF2_MEGNR
MTHKLIIVISSDHACTQYSNNGRIVVKGLYPVPNLTICLSNLQELLADLTDNGANDFPCKVVSGEHVYDLSELALRDKWKHVETLHTGSGGDKSVTYLSLCHPLRNVPDFCANQTGVCQSKIIENEGSEGNDTREELVVANGGMLSKQGFTVSNEGWLEYIYENGETCNHRGKKVSRKTYINFLCPGEGTTETTGPVMMSSPGCEIIFAWMTQAACPKKLEFSNATSCIVKFSNSDHNLNLHTLHSTTYWNASGSEGKNYHLNFCGAVENNGCDDPSATICEISDSGEQVVLGTAENMKLEWTPSSGNDMDVLTLTYNGPKDSKINLQLFCDKSALEPQIYFFNKKDTIYTFTVKTVAVCNPETPHCVIEDKKGNVYDLRNLHKPEGNWEVVDTRDEHQDLLYHINMCGGINDDPQYRCPEGHLGACQTSVSADASYNMGLLTSDPVVNAEGSITVLYTGGDPCSGGKHSRKTRITLTCYPQEYGPAFIEETESCEYIFSWLTPSACPQNIQMGENCIVSDPKFGNVYDLNPLRITTGDYNISDGEHQYLLNLCGPLVTPCKGTNHAGVCQVTGDQQYIGGNATSKIVFNDGTLLMNLEGGDGECQDNQTRSSQILFMCDHEEEGPNGLHFIHEDQMCTYHFIWRTKYACPPHKVIDCSVVHDGLKYDLSELSISNMNEEYFSSDHSKKYVLNVCRSIVHSKSSRCEYSAGACMINIKHNNETLNLGKVHDGPYVEDDKLMLKYDGGSLCKEDNQKNYETLIEFKCDMEGSYPYPQLIAQENCRLLFEWATPIACPEKAVESHGNCTVTNPLTDYTFDLNPLRHSAGYQVRDNTDLHIIINVCGDVEATHCNATGIGSCSFVDSDRTIISNAGRANADLHLHQGGLYLTYKDGEKCANGFRSTVINFICGAENSQEGPILIKDDLESCTYFFNWHTELACERRIDCFVDTWDQRYDLTPLIKVHDNYELVNPNQKKQKFYLNVCRPLNPMVGLNCAAGSSSCLVNADDLAKPLNLGHPVASPRNGYDDGVLMMYSHGGPCPDDPSISLTTRITFKCGRTYGKGSPEFVMETDDCQYQFEWKTSLVCPDEEPVPDNGLQCTIPYEAAQTNIDLHPLNRPDGYKVVHGQRTFIINVCGQAPGCDEGSGVCTSDEKSYGSSTRSDLRWDYDELKLSYYGGGTCDGALSGHRTTTIWFECDMSAGYGLPVADDFMNTLDCIAAFRWKTNVTCMEAIYGGGSGHGQGSTQAPVVIPSEPSDNHPSEPAVPVNPEPEIPSPAEAANHTQSPAEAQGSSSVLTVVAIFVTIFGLLFVAVLLLVKTTRGQYIMATTKRIFGIKGYSSIHENSTLLGNSYNSRVFRVDESDDDLLRV